MTGVVTERARLYQTVRTAHLERARALAPATILYRATRYDFDRALARDLDLIPAGPIRAAWLLARSRVRQLEVNEPLMLASLRRTALTLAVLHLRHRLGGPRTQCVSYAIENADPFASQARGRARLTRLQDKLLARFVWASLDRMVFGTESAQQTYASVFGAAAGPAHRTHIPALPSACTCPGEGRATAPRVVFLGALAARKGFPQLLDAWPYLKVWLPDVSLVILGSGPLEERARALADADAAVELHIDPARSDIHAELRRSRVLVLPSQPTPGWREQVGLPICEGLAHGTAIVTSTETGLAGWLDAHGHAVVDASAAPLEWARAVAGALRADRSQSAVLHDLPPVDGRLAADEWLFGDAT
ncbi:glycosyltransferase [Cryobacterium sp. SO2]|uniref:glycosyltransferase n=1 Tax=Cryobacterium sp. SO2 TaxID=1897060 RepID=UPI00223DF038|nr:glycosyltransferase [Cryobacterium sp. SO2]WEO76943.1 glycosyltransferase [Cryobacterium sp. SO2]